MKYIIATITTAFALCLSAQAADVSVKLTEVHLCCQGCVKGATKAAEKIPGVSATADSEEGSVSVNGPDAASVQQAVNEIALAGYFGKSSNPEIKITVATGAKGEKVQSLQVEGVHLCCGKCVKAVNTALESVAGVKANTAAKGSKLFEVTGDFNDQEVFAALQKAGLNGQAGK